MLVRNFTAGAQTELPLAQLGIWNQIPRTNEANPGRLNTFAAYNDATGEDRYLATQTGLRKATDLNWDATPMGGSQFCPETARELSAYLGFGGSQFCILMPRWVTPKIARLMTFDEALMLTYVTLHTTGAACQALPADITWRAEAMLDRMMTTGELRGCTATKEKLNRFNQAMGRASFALLLDKQTGANLTGSAFPDTAQLAPATRQSIDRLAADTEKTLNYCIAKTIQMGGPLGQKNARLRKMLLETLGLRYTAWEARSMIQGYGITQLALI